VVPGKSGESRLLKLAAQQDDPVMPPPDNKAGAKSLAPQELGLIRLWIDQGAKGEVLGLAGPLACNRCRPASIPFMPQRSARTANMRRPDAPTRSASITSPVNANSDD